MSHERLKGFYAAQHLEASRLSPKSRCSVADQISPAPLGSGNYHRYLQTAVWALKRDEALIRAHFLCEECPFDARPATEVHHLSYDRLGHELPHDLVAVCRQCHQLLHLSQPKNADLLEGSGLIWEQVVDAVNGDKDAIELVLHQLSSIDALDDESAWLTRWIRGLYAG